MIKEQIIVTAGHFDPITPHEFQFLQKCKEKGDWLIVGLYSDITLFKKTNVLNFKYDDRRELIQNLKCVDEVFTFSDVDGTVCNLLKLVKLCYPMAEITYITDSDMHNMPETKIKGINFEVLK